MSSFLGRFFVLYYCIQLQSYLYVCKLIHIKALNLETGVWSFENSDANNFILSTHYNFNKSWSFI